MKNKCFGLVIVLIIVIKAFMPVYSEEPKIKFKFTNADKAKVQYNLAVNFVKQKNFEKARKHFALSTQFDPTNYKAFYNLGIAHSMLKDHQQAISAFEKAVDLKPDDAFSYYNMAISFSELNKLDEACKNYELAIENKPDLSEAYANLAMLYLYKKQNNKYNELLVKLEKIDPEVAKMVKKAAGN